MHTTSQFPAVSWLGFLHHHGDGLSRATLELFKTVHSGRARHKDNHLLDYFRQGREGSRKLDYILNNIEICNIQIVSTASLELCFVVFRSQEFFIIEL